MTRAVLNQFASLTNPTLPNLDADFLGVANTLVVPCTASGTNAITLTPVASTVTVSAYTDKDQYTFVAAATSTGAMTVQVGSLGFLNLYKADGVTQANTGDIVSGIFYQIAYQSALNSAAGGFILVSAIANPTFSSVVVGSPSGGNQGAGTVNATNLFINGVAVTNQSSVPGKRTLTIWGMISAVSSTASVQYFFTAISGQAVSALQTNTGVTLINFTSMASNQYIAQANVNAGTLGGAASYTGKYTASSFTVFSFNTTTAAALNEDFTFTVIGP